MALNPVLIHFNLVYKLPSFLCMLCKIHQFPLPSGALDCNYIHSYFCHPSYNHYNWNFIPCFICVFHFPPLLSLLDRDLSQDTLFFRYVSLYCLHVRVYFTAFITCVHTRRRHCLWNFEHYEHISSAKRKLNLESSMIFWYTANWGTMANASLLCDNMFWNCK